ncbi:MAG: hypothetical protein LW711_14515 [Saprospiraceae bacterium]|jgi:hypothetical protein|nr:hypothetical protein [Algoriphagus sp.]MCE2771199.1 hypothetical protein [Saprospiraceae bacterium]
MKLVKILSTIKNIKMLASKKLRNRLTLFLMILSFPVFAQQNEDELPISYFGNWVEDLSECEGIASLIIADSEEGLLVSGLDWYSSEVKVENNGSFYTLFIKGYSEEGDFETEIYIKMDGDGYLFFSLDQGGTGTKLTNCSPIFYEEYVELEDEEITEGDEGFEVEELDMSNATDMGSLESELPSYFFGNWVEDLSQCEGVPPFSIDYADGGILVSGLDWYSTEVEVENNEDFYTLSIKGLSEEGEFEAEIIILMDEEENLIVSVDGGETGSKLVRCDLIADEEFVELQDEEFEMVDSLVVEPVAIELLQGTWQSLEDEDSYMVIEGDRMKNYYGGMEEELDNEMIMISDTCMNESDSENGLTEEKNRYLSNPNLDMCWYIEFLDENNLTLIYMARGNTLNFRRIE